MTCFAYRTFVAALFCTALVVPVSLTAQTTARAGASASASASASAPQGMTRIPTELVGGISSQNANVGQSLLAKVTRNAKLPDGTALPQGSQLMGRVTEVKSLAGGAGTSRLGMLFDQVKTPTGQVQKIKSMVQGLQPAGGSTMGGEASNKAVGASSESEDASASDSTRVANANRPGGGGGLLSGVTETVGGVATGVVNMAGGALGAVTGLPGVMLSQAGGASGVLSAKGKNVDLAGGTRISLAVSAAH